MGDRGIGEAVGQVRRVAGEPVVGTGRYPFRLLERGSARIVRRDTHVVSRSAPQNHRYHEETTTQLVRSRCY
jgi:hypothetical protein